MSAAASARNQTLALTVLALTVHQMGLEAYGRERCYANNAAVSAHRA
ncbi:hypothetical protein I546_1304 [Mycobacterium kansasii 732]|nr:hypothetical protein I546_1304 [Mycobacterium kansasii 732]